MTTSRIERKLGRRILATIAEMRETPRDNLKRFTVVQHRLARFVEQYKATTGKDRLIHPMEYYGYRKD